MVETQTHAIWHSDENTMLEEPALVNKEVYQACECDEEHQDVQIHGLFYIDILFHNTM
jgi:hypothetical protein